MKVSNNGVAGLNSPINKLDSGKAEKTNSQSSSADRVSVGKNPNQIASADKLAVSERAQSMSRAKEIASDSSIDEAKVARLQKMIDEGKYKTDASAIADRLVNEHLLMPE
jgi:negative regulator of flagellin synthesis FlgM